MSSADVAILLFIVFFAGVIVGGTVGWHSVSRDLTALKIDRAKTFAQLHADHDAYEKKWNVAIEELRVQESQRAKETMDRFLKERTS